VTASAATTPSSAAASPATALAGERQIRGANRNPERADTHASESRWPCARGKAFLGKE